MSYPVGFLDYTVLDQLGTMINICVNKVEEVIMTHTFTEQKYDSYFFHLVPYLNRVTLQKCMHF